MSGEPDVPLVLLHALGVDGRMFDDLRGRLTDVSTRAPDLPGHGTEPALPEGSGVEQWAAWLTAWLETEGLGPVDLLGVSLGGLLAQELAATRPELVRRVVVVDAVVAYPEPMRPMWRERSRAVRTDGTAAIVDPTLELWFTASTLAAGGPLVEAVRGALTATPPEGYARACALLAEVDLGDRLALLTQPTLVLCGADDAPPFRAAAEQLGQALPDVRVEWLPGRHAALLEAASEAAAAVTAFVRPAPSPSAPSPSSAVPSSASTLLEQP